jgi:hypothetical protein
VTDIGQTGDGDPGTELVGHGGLDRPDSPRCAACGEPHLAVAVFCEHCGHDLAQKHMPRRWVLDVGADREHFLRVAAGRADFPDGRGVRTIPVEVDVVAIGRAAPDDPDPPRLSLTDDLHDPAVSQRHARIVRDGDSLTIIDLGSTNGTTLNAGARVLVPGESVELTDGDRIHVGAWTSIRVRLVGDEGS